MTHKATYVQRMICMAQPGYVIAIEQLHIAEKSLRARHIAIKLMHAANQQASKFELIRTRKAIV
jgi:hypothetical protein